jgi:hypothetical protein
MTSAPYVHTAVGRAARFYLTAALLTLAIFVMDLWIPPGTGIAALYVVPHLIASYAGSARLHISVT